LLFGLVAVLTKATTFKLSESAHAPIKAALAAFVAAAFLALCANVPLLYSNVAVEPLRNMAWKHWDDPSSDALMRVTATRFKILIQARYVNSVKAIILMVAITAELVALVALAVAVWTIL
jgi:hypothetical protein